MTKPLKMIRKLEELSLSQIEALNLSQTFVIFATGPLEDHGPHLPIGLDRMEAEKLAEQVGEQLEANLPDWKVLLGPSAPLGVDSNTSRLALIVRGHVLRDWLMDSCTSLSKMGFTHFGCVSGHLGPKQLTAIEDAGRALERRSFLKKKKIRLLSLSSALASPAEMARAPLWPDALEHGGARDTSMALAWAPTLVQPGYLQLPRVRSPGSRWTRLLLRLRRKRIGYWGDPAAAHIQVGKDLLNQQATEIVTRLVPLLRAGSLKTSGSTWFRSWYSSLPPNRSTFAAWVLFMGTAILSTAWLYLVLSQPLIE